MENVWILYAYRFFLHLIPAYVIERLYWEERGMTIQMVVYTEIIYALTILLIEVPTGVLADRWGRKKLIVCSAVLGCGEFPILVYATEFWHFAVVVFLAGISYAASSGAIHALLYDSLLSQGKQESFEKHLGGLNSADLIAMILGALCGSGLANRFGFEFSYWLSFISMLVCLGASILLVEPKIKTRQDSPIKMREYVQASVHFFRKNPAVCLVILTGMVTGASLNFIDEFWQLYLERVEIPVLFFGLFSTGMMLIRLPGSLFAHLLKRRFRYRTLLLTVIAVFVIGFGSLTFVRNEAGLLAILLICLVAGLIDPLATGYLHHRIDSEMRATIDSFQSLGLNAVLLLTGLGFGYFSTQFDLFGGFGWLAFTCSLFLLYFLTQSKQIVD